MFGFIAGIMWLFALDRIRGKDFDYMLTLAVIFVLYAFTESIKGSGAIAALIFGIVLGNSEVFSKILKLGKRFVVKSSMKVFHGEISFFIRSFFFVFLGMIVTIKQDYLIYGLALSAVLILARTAAVHISVFRTGISRMDANIMKIMAPRGLAAAVLTQIPAEFGINGAEIFSNIVFVVILATVIYTTIMIKFFYREARGTPIRKDRTSLQRGTANKNNSSGCFGQYFTQTKRARYKYFLIQESFATEKNKEVKRLATKEEIIEKLKFAATAEELEQVKLAIKGFFASTCRAWEFSQ